MSSGTLDKPYWAATGSKRTVFHHKSECPALDPSSARPRSQRYVDYHELDECHVCRPLDGVNWDVIVYADNDEGGDRVVHLLDPEVNGDAPFCGATLHQSEDNDWQRTSVAAADSTWRLCSYCAGGAIDPDDDRPLGEQIAALRGGGQ